MSLGSEFINQLRKFERDVSPDGSGDWGFAHKFLGPGDYAEQNNVYHQSQDPNAPKAFNYVDFDDDLSNYSTKNEALNDVRSYVVEDYNGNRFPMSIGYDSDGKISLVEGHDGNYYSVGTPETIADYFKNNFDPTGKYRVYTVDYGKTPEETSYGKIWFDSSDGEMFVPSKVFDPYRPYAGSLTSEQYYYGNGPKLTSPNSLPSIAEDYKR